MEIHSEDKQIILRDFIKSDINDYVRWHTVDMEWMNWDSPWEAMGSTIQEELRYWTEYYRKVTKTPRKIRTRLEIMLNNNEKTHIGWVIRYNIDKNYNDTAGKGYCTIGIDIPEPQYRGRGYGYRALQTFIRYLRENGIASIYMQTWSGNDVMIGLANKLGFQECHRIIGTRTVQGRRYDALTFVLLP
ncbi:MAG: GNAT family protein [Bacilli bacterium]|nr:GNAT family protein [Bacilli bacterium]